MEILDKYLKENQGDYISFKDGKAHTLTLGKVKEDQIKDNRTDEMVNGVKFLVTEDNKAKTFFTTSIALIKKLNKVELKTTVKIQSKKVSSNGKPITTYDVWLVDGEVETEITLNDDDDDGIPVIEEGEEVIKTDGEVDGVPF